MLRSLFAGISGLRVNQTMLDVTGNNIANANTTGFKGNTIVFQDTLSQIMTGAGAPDPAPGGNGGTNPIQVGLGVQVAATTGNFNQGAAQVTGRATDLMIQGDGFFVIGQGDERTYTRAGAFTFDALGNLVAPSGKPVQGWPAGTATTAATGNVNVNATPAAVPAGEEMTSYSIGTDGKLRGIFSDGIQRDMKQLALADFNNPMGLEKVGDTMYRETLSSGNAQVGAPGAGRRGLLMSGALEMSNVDLAAEFTNLIVAQRGFQANSRVITTSDQVLEDLVNIKR